MTHEISHILSPPLSRVCYSALQLIAPLDIIITPWRMESTLNLEQIPNVEIGLLSEIDPGLEERPSDSSRPLPGTLLHYAEVAAQQIGLHLTRTPHCKHKGSCVCACVASSLKAAVLSYLIKSGIGAVFSVRKIAKEPRKLLEVLGSGDSLKFGAFIGLFLVTFRVFICGLRRVLREQHHKYAYLLGGLVGGTLAALLLDKKTRQTFGLFLIARVVDITYRSLVHKKVIPQLRYFYPFLYGLMMFVTGGLALGSQPASMSPQLSRFYLMFTSETPTDQQIRRIWIERKNLALLKKGVPTYNALDYLPKARAIYQREVLKKQS